MAFKKNRHPQANMPQDSQSTGYRPAYIPGSQGHDANNAFRNQTGATQYSRSNPAYSSQRKRKSGKGKKTAIGVCCALVVALIGCGTAFAVWLNGVNSQLNTGDKTSEELESINEQLVTSSFDEPFYMMLIGSDKREDDEEMGARSDTNIVVRIDPVNNQATLVSIPRDTMIDIDGYGTNKFNAAYNYGGAAAAIREASQLTGVDISHYAEVNFDALVSLVDAVGGVDVVVDERIDDPDADNSWSGTDPVIIEEGEQHLNGTQALVFARSRAYVDGDFTRTSNQRKLIEALANKVLSLPVTELPGVVQAAAKCVTTDMKIADIISLAQQFQGNGDLTMYSAMLPSITGYVGDVSYVFADEDKVKEMMQIVGSGGIRAALWALLASLLSNTLQLLPQTARRAAPARTRATITTQRLQATGTERIPATITASATPTAREAMEQARAMAMLTTRRRIVVRLARRLVETMGIRIRRMHKRRQRA